MSRPIESWYSCVCAFASLCCAGALCNQCSNSSMRFPHCLGFFFPWRRENTTQCVNHHVIPLETNIWHEDACGDAYWGCGTHHFVCDLCSHSIESYPLRQTYLSKNMIQALSTSTRSISVTWKILRSRLCMGSQTLQPRWAEHASVPGRDNDL